MPIKPIFTSSPTPHKQETPGVIETIDLPPHVCAMLLQVANDLDLSTTQVLTELITITFTINHTLKPDEK